MTTGWTEEDANALRAAMATGAKSVRIKGEETVFRTLDEMERLLALIECDLRPSKRTRRTLARFSRGL